jgi:hypothetical protein
VFGHLQHAGSLRTCRLSAATTAALSLLGTFYERGETGVTLYQGDDVTVARTAEQIALPMTRNGAVFDFRRPFPCGDGIDDLTAGMPADTRVPRAAYAPLGPKVLNQLFFQHFSRLNE